MKTRKINAHRRTRQKETLPVSTDGLAYVSYKHSLYSTVLHDTAYTMKIIVYPDGRVRVQERVGHGKISDQRQYNAAPEAVAAFFAAAVDCINHKHPDDAVSIDDCTGKLTLYYKDRSVRVDRGAHDERNDVYLGDLAMQFFEENSIGWDISEEGWQIVSELIEQRSTD